MTTDLSVGALGRAVWVILAVSSQWQGTVGCDGGSCERGLAETNGMGVVTYIMHGQCGCAVVDRAENRARAYNALSRLHLTPVRGSLHSCVVRGLLGGEVSFGRANGGMWNRRPPRPVRM